MAAKCSAKFRHPEFSRSFRCSRSCAAAELGNRVKDSLTRELILERGPIELGAQPREHCVQSESDPKKKHQFARQSHAQQLLLELDIEARP